MTPYSDAVPMEARRTRLSPPTPQFVEEIYQLAATDRIPWMWPGAQTRQAFYETFLHNVFVQFAIQDVRNDRSVALAWAYDVSPFHGFCYVSMVTHPDYRRRAWPLEGTLLFANYLFTKLNLRNIYATAAGPHFEQFRSGEGNFFQVEGRLTDRFMLNGEPEDLYILTFKRERWLERGKLLLESRLTPPDPPNSGLGSLRARSGEIRP